MTISKTIRLYEFEELGESIQDSIISSYIQDLPGWWSDDTEERIRNEAKAIGIEDFDFIWSGFWSQGDGLSFTGELDFKTWLHILQQRFPDWADDKSKTGPGYKSLGLDIYDVVREHENNIVEFGDVEIHRHNNMYCHENTVEVLAPICEVHTSQKHYWEEYRLKFGGNVKKALTEWKNELCYKWYSELQEAYEFCTQRENVVEALSSRELLYTSSGTIIENGELV